MPILGEAVALVMGDTRIWSAGVYWDQNKFPNKTYFAPYAYKEELNTRKFKVNYMIIKACFKNSQWYLKNSHKLIIYRI